MTWFITHSGQKFMLEDLRVERIVWTDVAISLSKLCRWNGHCHGFYSVAQHSVMASDKVRELGGPGMAIYGALHDAHEAYLGDIIAPVKALLGPELKALEERVDAIIYEAAGIEPPGDAEREVVKTVDARLLQTEGRDLILNSNSWVDFDQVYQGKIVPLEPIQAAAAWIARFESDLAAHRTHRQ